MEPVPQAALRVEVGGAVADDAAAGHELVEPVQPAQARRLPEGHVSRMHRPRDGRLPAELDGAGGHPPDAEAAVRQQKDPRVSRHELDEQHAVAPAPGEPPRPHGERALDHVDEIVRRRVGRDQAHGAGGHGGVSSQTVEQACRRRMRRPPTGENLGVTTGRPSGQRP
jgi:hypothetical protein